MPHPPADDFTPFEADENLEAFLNDDPSQWLDCLRQSDRPLDHLMALEVWSIAQTMEDLVPGFWNRFVENRQIALHHVTDRRSGSTDEVSPQSDDGD